MVKPAYSVVEHLAKSIWLSRWRDGYFAVFSAYFDASGAETDKQVKYVAVSGFIAHTDIWIEWEKNWLDCLERYGILNEKGLPEFHMAECANYTYSFKGWDKREQDRQSLLRELIEIIKVLGRKASCVINIELFKKHIDADLREDFFFSGAYVLGGRACAARVREWCKQCNSPIFSQVQLFFEQGDGKVLQTDLRDRFLGDEFPEPFFRHKRNKYSKSGELIEERLIPFQAADVLAYLTNINAKFSERGHWGDKEKIRWMYEDLSQMAEQTVVFSEADMKGLNELMRVSRNNPLNPA
ncbi:MAG: hypothetical protein H8K07_13060 [Nitrospira sp.]|nr:hypothetical protein [Nitrospira sp.]